MSALLPGPVEGQVVLDERSTSDRLSFSIRSKDDVRLGVWQGRFDGVHEIFYQFRVQSRGVSLPLPEGAVEPPPAGIAKSYGRASHEFPASAVEIRDALERLALADGREPGRPRAQGLRVRDARGRDLGDGGLRRAAHALPARGQRDRQGAPPRHAAPRRRGARAPRARPRAARAREPRGEGLVRGVARRRVDSALARRRLLRRAPREPRAARRRRARARRGDRRAGRRLPLPLAPRAPAPGGDGAPDGAREPDPRRALALPAPGRHAVRAARAAALPARRASSSRCSAT